MNKRKELPSRRVSDTHKKRVGRNTVFFTLGRHADGTIGEVWIDTAKSGTDMRELMHGMARMTSLALQYGASIDELISVLENGSPHSIPVALGELLKAEQVEVPAE